MRTRIAVVGAGISGLSSALVILQRFGDSVELSVISDKTDYQETTSYVAAGLWRPDDKYDCDQVARAKLKKWFLTSRKYFETAMGKLQNCFGL